MSVSLSYNRQSWSPYFLLFNGPINQKDFRKTGGGEEEEEEEEEEEYYEDERTKHFLLHVTLFALLQIGFHSAFLSKWVEV